MFLQLWCKYIHTYLLQTDTHTDRHDDGIYSASIVSRDKNLHSHFVPLVCNGVVVASQSFFEVCLLPFSSRPNWSAVVDCGLLIISNLPWSVWLSFVLCRRFGLSPFWPGIRVTYMAVVWLGRFPAALHTCILFPVMCMGTSCLHTTATNRRCEKDEYS